MAERRIIVILTAGLLWVTSLASAQKVEISTDKKSYAKNEEINVTVTVTDDNGNPVETALRFAAYRVGRGKTTADEEEGNKTSYSDIFSMINQIKPFRLEGNRIIFRSVAPNTLRTQDGAILVLNGSLLGQDASAIQYLNPNDIERINVSTDFADIQKYTGFNTMGVIEIYTKKGDSAGKHDPDPEMNPADSPESITGGRLIYSNKEIHTDNTGKAGFVFPAGKRATEVVIIVTTAEPGTNPSSSRLTITVK